jgi:hypothetical protein
VKWHLIKFKNLGTCPTKMIKFLAQYFLDEDLQLNMMKLLVKVDETLGQ